MASAASASPTRPPKRWVSARHPFIYEINTWPWLTELSAATGKSVDLSTVPERQWDAIADAGFDAVWLMGVWARSPAGVAVALANHDLVASFRSALTDWAPADVVGSPYCIRDYVVDPHLGGNAALAAARAALADRGVALILDFVPNHVAPDHPWTSTNPEYFVQGSWDDVRADPESYTGVDGTVFANGRDPYFPAWPDVLQLNAFSPGLREAIVGILRDIADLCDGVRCDMAMLTMNDVFAGTWQGRVGDPPAAEYWPATIGAVRRTHPSFTFLAEAYWNLEGELQRQGFDFCYDKRLYDSLVDDDAVAIRQHLAADTGFQNRLLRFAENHDEPRMAATFAADRAKAATMATLTQTGARLVYHGQIEGRKIRLPVFLGRSTPEGVDTDMASFHRVLLATLCDNTFRTGDWSLCETSSWPGNDSFSPLVAWCWEGERRWLIIVNLSAATASGRVWVPWDVTGGIVYRLADPTTAENFIRTGDELLGGLLVELCPWRWHCFRVEPVDQMS
jgi:Alpha amylase, catalytic domain